MKDQDSLPERSTRDRDDGRRQGRGGAETAASHRAPASRRARPALPSLCEALTAAFRQRVASRAVREPGSRLRLVGHICEQSIVMQPAPGGGEMGVCEACQQEPHAVNEAPEGG
jgi:hypothetical protein